MKGVVDRFSEEFVETRRKALDKFLKRVADHPVLSFNEHFNVFLSTKVSARGGYHETEKSFHILYPVFCIHLSRTMYRIANEGSDKVSASHSNSQ